MKSVLGQSLFVADTWQDWCDVSQYVSSFVFESFGHVGSALEQNVQICALFESVIATF